MKKIISFAIGYEINREKLEGMVLNMEKEVNNLEEDKKQKNSRKWQNRKLICIVIAIVIIVAIAGIIIFCNISQNNFLNQNEMNSMSGETATTNEDMISLLFKPVIYLYPEEQTNLTIKLGKKENITCSYPEYSDGWDVIANPDGTLVDQHTGRKLYCLYWEGKDDESTNMTDGFVVKGSDTIEFLEEKLAKLGLNEFEAEEFIIYWLPRLQNNEYNYIRFANLEEINEKMPLEFSVEPDSIIRVLMQFKPLEEYIEIPEQKLTTPERNGFVVVEWGGSEIK